jgi:SAM-dependent methyltransferase
MSDRHEGHQGHGHGPVGGDEPPVLDAAFWDARYSDSEAMWSGEPNPTLVELLTDVDAGRALEVACGEGADAVWLARQGWDVVAVDLSEVAVRRASELVVGNAAEVAPAITFVVGDVVEDRLPAGPFDLVVAFFLHVAEADRAAALRNRAALVAPGGLLLDVQHDRRDLATGVERPPFEEWYVRDGELAGLLGDGWDVLVDEPRPRDQDDDEGVTVHDAVLLARRTG